MDLAQTKVLIDGYNLDLVQGTGIKTYGFSLLDALSIQGASVSVLTSRERRDDDNLLLREVLFADNYGPNPRGKLSQRIQLAKEKLAMLAPVSLNTVTIPRIGVVPNKEQDILGYPNIEILNASNCYRIANARFKVSKFLTHISTPKGFDVWHSTYPLPMKVDKAKKITTIHDLIPLKLPYSTLDDKTFFYENIKQSLRTSDLILAVSEATKTDLLSLFDVDDEKIFVTYQAATLDDLQPDEIENGDLEKQLKKYKLEKGKFFLFVGAIEPKKNVGRLIEAYIGLDTDIPLVIAGKKAWFWEKELEKADFLPKPRRAKSKKQVRLLEYVPTDDLRYLYSGAYCLVFPSLYEGFGLPVLEAMKLGCPVITSKAASLPEIGGDAALYVDPYSVKSIRRAMETVVSDQAFRQTMVQKGLQQAEVFSKSNYQDKISKAYQRVLSL